MIYEGKKVQFPAVIETSFSKVIDAIIEKKDSCRPELQAYYNKVLAKVKDKEWASGIVELDEIKKHQDEVNELMDVLFPSILTSNEIKAVTSPWGFESIYKSARMNKMYEAADDDFSLQFVNVDLDNMYISACSAILAIHYGYNVPISRPYITEVYNKITKKTRSYKMIINGDFMEISKGANCREITIDDYHELMDNFMDIDLWKEKFPPNSWMFSGVLVVSLFDVNTDTILNNITEILLNSEMDSLVSLEEQFSELIGKDIRLSFVGTEGLKLVQGPGVLHPLMMGDKQMCSSEDLMCQETLNELIHKNRPFAIPDVAAFDKKTNSEFSKNLKKAGVKSYYATPVEYNGNKIGILELGSEDKGVLNSTITVQLEQVLPILAVAGNRAMQEKKNRIDAIIQEECTTIHNSVKWKFEEEAYEHLRNADQGINHVFKDLVFSDVYPLYGQLDIRSSSTIRNDAIRKDLLSQLSQAKSILKIAKKQNELPLYDELIFVLDQHIKDLKFDIVSSSEQVILQFLNTELDPIFEHLSGVNSKIDKAFTKYKNTLHQDLKFVYQERKKFDESVNKLNQVLANYIDDKQEEAQLMFPHYFERYKTDGLEFNMYIGESITPNNGFHPLLVKNLRLWQLMVMIEMERAYKVCQQTMSMPLEVASLILSFSNSLSIQFRMDEKRFDVEGAYNARYEIIKKRIDKAHIRGTKERITEPGKMVVVYSKDEDEQEYLRYFKFLKEKGYVKDVNPEIVTLEDLQGVSGLKAIRMDVNYEDVDEINDATFNKLLAELNAGSVPLQ